MIYNIKVLYKYTCIMCINKIKEFFKVNFMTNFDENKLYKNLKYMIPIALLLEILLAWFIGYCLDFFIPSSCKLTILNNDLLSGLFIFAASFIFIPKIGIQEKLKFVEERSLVLTFRYVYNLFFVIFNYLNICFATHIAGIFSTKIFFNGLYLLTFIFMIMSIYNYFSIKKVEASFYEFVIIILFANILFFFIAYTIINCNYQLLLVTTSTIFNKIFIIIFVAIAIIVNYLNMKEYKNGITIEVKTKKYFDKPYVFKNTSLRMLHKFIVGLNNKDFNTYMMIIISTLIINTFIICKVININVQVIFSGLMGYLFCYFAAGIAFFFSFIILSYFDFSDEKEIMKLNNYKRINYNEFLRGMHNLIFLIMVLFSVILQIINYSSFNIFSYFKLIIMLRTVSGIMSYYTIISINAKKSTTFLKKIVEEVSSTAITIIVSNIIFLTLLGMNQCIGALIQLLIYCCFYAITKFIITKIDLIYI